ncbi:MAG: 16S rRNA (uracil(1498)-N(3))-methyltransferase [Proteobacteria bacterium]|nr:16S rRNA (uracil(1498)-N(3))-methyltransferase [Pseudomonadota bacterium]MBU1387344.1 16S rRNA (uracil(1498)-N(3))-methyltransferase [Pseudomonadota bacterium]MBU1544327.1 16S rRNA (uracil(1498)-N(3))-methyltransferase [Pseudomonadota bacterium]MBU2482668.1 16S rRNA (uracil(1498)-N(3))-methyltransferase [Pseudomonadota bacterium]
MQIATQKFIVPDIQTLPAEITIQGQDAKHIRKVLRLRPDDPLTITDGQGKDYAAQIMCVSKDSVRINVISDIETGTESALEITLCTGMLKDKKMDFVIKHVTQLGIRRWIPFFCEHAVPLPDPKKIKARQRRWETIAKESLKQCRRSLLPEITDPVNFENLLEVSDQYDRKIIFSENSAQPPETLKTLTPVKNIMVLIGPEGGFSRMEIQLAQAKGFIPCLMGPRILRAETAAICACTLVQHILGDI